MVESHADQLNALAKRLEEVEHYLQIEQKRYRRAELQESLRAAGFLGRPPGCSGGNGRDLPLGDDIKAYDGACELLEEAQSADELALEADDEETSEYAGDCVARLGGMLDELELSSWFTGKFDRRRCRCDHHPGTGRLRGPGLDRDAAPYVPALLRAAALEGRGHRRPGG